MSSKKSAFVTGATGFLGLNLIGELCSAGYEVTALRLVTEPFQIPNLPCTQGRLQNVGRHHIVG